MWSNIKIFINLLSLIASAKLDVTVNYSEVVVITVFSVSYNQTFYSCLRGLPSVVAGVFPFQQPEIRLCSQASWGIVWVCSDYCPFWSLARGRVGVVSNRTMGLSVRYPFIHWLLRCYVTLCYVTTSVPCPQSNPIVQFDITPTQSPSYPHTGQSLLNLVMGWHKDISMYLLS